MGILESFSNICMCGPNLLWGVIIGALLALILHAMFLALFTSRDIDDLNRQIPEETKFFLCVAATLVSSWAFRRDIVKLCESIGIPESYIPYLALTATVLALTAYSLLHYTKYNKKMFVPPVLLEGNGPLVFFSVIGGWVILEFMEMAYTQPGGLWEWMPLIGVVAGSGLLSWRGVKYGQGHELFPAYITQGWFPTAFIVVFGWHTVVEFYNSSSNPDTEGQPSDWMPLLLISLGSGIISYAGAMFYQKQQIIPNWMITGRFPLVFMGLFGGYTIYEFINMAMDPATEGKFMDWVPLIIVSVVSGAVSYVGARVSQTDTHL